MDLQLILALIAGIATIVVIVLATRLDAFIALLLAAVVTGIVAGQDLLSIVDSITTGFGDTLASIGIVIGSVSASARSSRSPVPPTPWPEPSCAPSARDVSPGRWARSARSSPSRSSATPGTSS